MSQPRIVFIVGPTAIGKSEAAVLLAERMGVEIVSCDSMQTYREINIASSKPPPSILKKVPHHLINVVSVEEPFDVAQYNRLANAAIKEIHKKGKVALVVGGSGLYMQVLLDGIFEGGPQDPDLRQKLENEIEKKGIEHLYERLKNNDPEAAARIHVNNRRRIIRALEIYESQRAPLTTLQKTREGLWGKFDIHIFALTRPREELYGQINRRVDSMFKEGLVEEIKQIAGLRLSPTAQGLIGVKETMGFLKGQYDLDRAKYLMKLNTRHFAKRQLTWFRKDQRLKWILIEKDATLKSIAHNIENELKRKA